MFAALIYKTIVPDGVAHAARWTAGAHGVGQTDQFMFIIVIQYGTNIKGQRFRVEVESTGEEQNLHNVDVLNRVWIHGKSAGQR